MAAAFKMSTSGLWFGCPVREIGGMCSFLSSLGVSHSGASLDQDSGWFMRFYMSASLAMLCGQAFSADFAALNPLAEGELGCSSHCWPLAALNDSPQWYFKALHLWFPSLPCLKFLPSRTSGNSVFPSFSGDGWAEAAVGV